MIQLNIFLYLALLIFNSCFLPGEDHPVKTDSIPENLKIRYSKHTGMLPEYETLLITKDSCVYISVDAKTIDTVKFQLTESELNSLYDLFIANEFSYIESDIREVYDRGGISVSLSWKDGITKSTEKSNAGRSFVKEEWIENWNIIVSELQKIVMLYKKSKS